LLSLPFTRYALFRHYVADVASAAYMMPALLPLDAMPFSLMLAPRFLRQLRLLPCARVAAADVADARRCASSAAI